MTEEQKQITPEDARKVLADAQRLRLAHCQAELNELLERHGCTLTAQPFITQEGRIAANVVLVDAPSAPG